MGRPAVKPRLTIIALAFAAVVATACGTASGAEQAQIRHIDLSHFPRVAVTALAPTGVAPSLFENGQRAAYLVRRELGSAQAIVLAIDNSQSMRGTPLRGAKAAAAGFMAQQRRAGSAGVVSFAHEALPLTPAAASRQDAGQALTALRADLQSGTALYDAVSLATTQLKKMSAGGTRVLIVLSDGVDRGSQTSLQQAVDLAQSAGVTIYTIAAGARADTAALSSLANETGGRMFGAGQVRDLDRVYHALGREIQRTWRLTYVSSGRPGDRLSLELRARGRLSRLDTHVPKREHGLLAGIPAIVTDGAGSAAALIALVTSLLAAAGVLLIRRLRRSQVAKLLEPHLLLREEAASKPSIRQRFDGLFTWAEGSLEQLPGSPRLRTEVERSGLKLRLGHLPYLSFAGAFLAGAGGAIVGLGAFLTMLLMLAGLVAPLAALKIAAQRRRKAFDTQLPDVLAMIASTLRAGHGLRPALRGIAAESSAPACEEFARVLAEERLGRPLDEAIVAMCERIGSPDLEYVATAISVQSQAGGSLAATFDTMSETVRERQRHARKVRALTSMGRMSAIVLALMPIGLAVLMSLISPSYMRPLWSTPPGHFLIVFSLISMGIGALILKRIVNVRS
jgi:tight adherence protein B